MKVTKRFAELFWTAPETEHAAEPTPASVPPSNVVPLRPTVHADGSGSALDALFAAAFAKTPGDAKIDQILIAFESMQAAMAAQQLAVALSATIVALGVPDATLVSTIESRLRVVATVVAEEQRRTADRQVARGIELEATTAAVHAEIATMEARIVALRGQLASATESLARKTAGERAGLAALEQRAHVEATRLAGLRDVLGPTLRLARKK
jgi:hypothetical protein